MYFALQDGPCNGTKLIIKQLNTYCLTAEIITGKHVGNVVFIPRVDLSPPIEEIPFKL